MKNQSIWDEYKVLLQIQKRYEDLAVLERVGEHANKITNHIAIEQKTYQNLAYLARKDVEAFETKYIVRTYPDFVRNYKHGRGISPSGA